MSYTKTTWTNSSGQPISATNLNKIEQGVYDAHAMAAEVVNSVSDLKSLAGIGNGEVVQLLGFYTPGDGGGGLIRRGTSLSTFDEGTTYDHTTEAGGWERVDVSVVNVKWFGAKGDGTGDDGPEINAAILAATNLGGEFGYAVFVPPGDYLCTTQIVGRDFVHVFGAGGYSTTLRWGSTGVFIDAPDSTLVFSLSDIRLTGTLSSFTLLRLANSFSARYTRVVFDGTNLPDSAKPNQTGLLLELNSGDNQFVSCTWNNFGTAIMSKCIQNYVTGSTFHGCIRSIWVPSDAPQYNAGLDVSNVTMTGGRDSTKAGRTLAHVQIDQESNSFNFSNIWVEGCDKSFILGPSGGQGPAHFGLHNAAIGCRDTHLVINGALHPHLSNIRFMTETDVSDSSTTTGPEMIINATNAPTGTAENLTTMIAANFDIPLSQFPAGWTYLGRGIMRSPGALYGATAHQQEATFVSGMRLDSTTGPRIVAGTGSPEGSVTAPIGSIYTNKSGGQSTTLYSKSTGTGNTGWRAVTNV